MLRSVFWLALLVPFCASGADLDAMYRSGVDQNMNGQFVTAMAIASDMKKQAPDNTLGYTLSLAILSSELSYDEEDPRFDKAIRSDVKSTLAICEPRITRKKATAVDYYHCGQAYFYLSFVDGLRGSYYAAGTEGTRAIRWYERALEMDPSMTDVKLQLGMAYYYADHLPPFIRALSRLLWFIPSGNADKSLPYIREVMVDGRYYRDVATFIYADLLRKGTDEERESALPYLADLIERYPDNNRVRIAHLSLLLQGRHYQQVIAITDDLLTEHALSDLDRFQVKLSHIRALLGVGQPVAAIEHFAALGDAPSDTPRFVRPWLSLTSAQVNDLQAQRQRAIEFYQRALEENKHYLNSQILEAARSGLAGPYRATH